ELAPRPAAARPGGALRLSPPRHRPQPQRCGARNRQAVLALVAELSRKIVVERLAAFRLELVLGEDEGLHAVEAERAEILPQLAPGGEHPDRSIESEAERP